MTFLLIALLIAFAVVTGIVLADSGLRMWSALSGMRAQQAALANPALTVRARRGGRVTTRVSYARPASLRAAA